MPAKTVYDEVDIILQGGKEITLRPLPIGLLKKFMKVWEKLGDVTELTEEEAQFHTFDVFLNCAGVAISREFSDKFEKPVGADGTLSEAYREYLEETLDTPTIYKIIEIASGIDLNDPKLTEAAEAIVAAETPGLS